MQIGPYSVRLLTLGHFRMDGGGLFGIIPKKLWQRAYPHADEENRVLMSARALLVTGNGVTLVADAGLGEKLDDKLRKIFCVEQQPNALVAALQSRGVVPADVTHFVYTHLHFDHAGGATQLDGSGTVTSVFPNARHYIQREHLAWARCPSDKDRASFTPHNWEPVIQAGLLQELEAHTELLPGIELVPVSGHTPAMQMVLVRGEGGAAIYTIDLFPSAAHIPAHYIAAFDNYPLQALEEKRAFLTKAADEQWVVCFGHDPQLAGVIVSHAAKGFEIQRRVSIEEFNAG